MKILTLLATATLATALPLVASDAPKPSGTATCCDGAACSNLINAYEKVSNALAADNLTDAQAAAVDLKCWATCADQTALATGIEKFAGAASIDDARAVFKTVSAAVIPLAEKAGAHFVMTCPMARADWIQTSATVANPYYGSQMLRCGGVKKTVKSGS